LSPIVFYDYSVKTTWDEILQQEFSTPYFLSMSKLLHEERARFQVFPPEEKVFAALSASSFENTKVVILGQDPYHGAQQADGLAFSVSRDTAIPPSLRNIFKELHNDIGVAIPKHGDLSAWAHQGVLLLNTTLTVREGEPGSHYGRGWETLTDAMIRVSFFCGAHTHERRKPSLPSLTTSSSRVSIPPRCRPIEDSLAASHFLQSMPR
jgi:uracil-DNA glycosylase